MVETVTRALEKTQQQLETKVAEARKAKQNCKSIELFNMLPDTMDELKEAINEFKGRLECMGDVDQNVKTPNIINHYIYMNIYTYLLNLFTIRSLQNSDRNVPISKELRMKCRMPNRIVMAWRRK